MRALDWLITLVDGMKLGEIKNMLDDEIIIQNDQAGGNGEKESVFLKG